MAATQGDTAEIVPSPLEIVIREQGTTTTIAVAGEWDLEDRQATRRAIGTAFRRSPESVVLDLSQLSFIDSSGIHVIVELQRRSAQHNIRLVIVPGCRAVQRPFELLRLSCALPFVAVSQSGREPRGRHDTPRAA
jgi:anti-sigma B factor antagonist